MKPAAADRIEKRELAFVATLSAALAIACSWPLVLGLRSRIPNTLMDPPFKAWEVSWIGHAVREHPLHLWDANTYWPHDTTLAFSDAMVGTAPLTWLADGFRSSLAVYNVLFLLSFAVAFAGAYLLAREFGLTPAAGVVAAAAFAYSPVRFAHASHLHVLTSGGIALSLFLLLRGYRTRRPRTVVAGWLVGAWQLSLGFSLGLQLTYLLAVLALLSGVALLRRRPAVNRPLALATLAGAGVFTLTGGLLAQPYLEVARDFPESRRTAVEISSLSPMPWSFVAAPERNLLWGDATARIRETLRAPAEQTLFPGLTTVVLAVVGMGAHVLPRRPRVALTVGVVATAMLALGLHVSLGKLGWLLPYRYLFEFGPGWEGVRTPGRIFTLTSLGLALLAAAGAAAVIQRFGRHRWALVAVLAGAIVLEGYADIPYPRVPPVPPGQLGLRGPQLHLPTEAQRDSLYMLWSTEGFPPIVNGHDGFKLPPLDHIRTVARDFPSDVSVDELRRLGIRYVVFHPQLAKGTPWEPLSDPRAPAPGADVDVERGGGVVIYRLVP